MKILFITPGCTARGGHIVLTAIIRNLRAEGCDVDVVSVDSRDRSKDVLAWRDIDPFIITVPDWDSREEMWMSGVGAATDYIRMNVQKYDKIIVDSWYLALSVIRSGVALEKIFHLVQSNPTFTPEDRSKFWKSELFDLLPHTQMNRIVVSQALANHFIQRYNKKFDAMQLFVDERYLQADFDVRDRTPLKIVISSATFDLETKGLDFLLEQLNSFKGYPFELTLISGKPIQKDLTAYPFPVSVASAQDADEMVELLRENDIYVNTSTDEAFCLALAEAMAMGMPSIALDSIGNREYMDGENAIFVEDPKCFLDGLAQMEDANFRKALSKKAKESMQKYTLENTLKDFKKIVGI